MPERAYLVAVETKGKTDVWSAEDSLAELAQLAATAGADVVGSMIQRLSSPSKTHYLGQGKLEELLSRKGSISYDMVIFDDELSPLQQRNLEDFLETKVVDRVTLILDIFAQRAHTREGKLQVELAQHQYLFPRLMGRWRHLERLGAGIGTRGPGESQLETDRRLIRRRIHRLEQQIERVRTHRLLYRQKRKKSGLSVVALVGYTNTGKSTLLNALSQASVFVEDKLFATLDPTTRRVTLPGNKVVLITDTVGFIRKLPPTIITAFRATLEELSEASILLHVVDFSLHNAAEQNQVVEDILRELDLQDKPRITILNKIDRMLDPNRTWTEQEAMDYLSDQRVPLEENTVLVSATRGWGLKRLLEVISLMMAKTAALSPAQEKDAL
ncbi:MAG: GTPase HflX [Chloroflexi bacterium]|nr:GTPase HflX [Chloroflexota bacterium]